MTAGSGLTWDDERLRRDRLARVQAQMRQRNVGALLLADGSKCRYVLNVQIPGAKVYVPVEGSPLAIVRPRDIGYVRMEYPNVRLPFREGLGAGIMDLMREDGLADATLAVTGLDTDDFLSLVNGGARISNAVPIIESAWTVKTEDELTIYRHIGEQYARTMQVSRESIRPGVTENQLSATVTAAWYDTGGEGLLQINVCAGEDMNPWRRWPSQRAIADGEFVGIDLHGRGYAGLHGDATRTYFVGDHPTTEQRDLYRRAYDYIKAMTSIIEAGLSIAEICERAPKIPDEYREALWDLNLAHAIGPGASGEPRLDPRKPRKDVVLEPNQVLSVECYFGEKGSPLAVKLEDDIIVRQGPPELLGPSMPYDERFIG